MSSERPVVYYVVVQFYPWFKIYFLFFQTNYHTLPYSNTKENKLKPRIRLNHKIYTKIDSSGVGVGEVEFSLSQGELSSF